LIDWAPVRPPAGLELAGDHVTLRPVQVGDAEALFEASRDPAIWAYLPYGPYASIDEMRARLAEIEGSTDPLFYALVHEGAPQGIASYLRIEPTHGVIEIGHIWFGSALQRTTAATEAIFLLARHAFDDLGYRRLEWKCNAANEKSRRAAQRFGFTFEGVFRNHMVVKGRNRDSAWYSIIDDEWPAIRAAFERWLAPENFDRTGTQKRALQTGGD
jgi:RimJ/RimL family protein N-acetyltransferase